MKFIYLFIICVFTSISGFSQFTDETLSDESEKKESKFDKSKLYYGGYINVSLGNYTVIGAAPLVGYKLTQQLSIGGQLSYEYIRNKSYSTVNETSSYGYSAFGRFRVVPQLYVHLEFSQMNYQLYDVLGKNDRAWVPFLFVGGGYSQPITNNTWLNAQVLFDVINDENSPYKNWEPYYSVGIGIGF